MILRLKNKLIDLLISLEDKKYEYLIFGDIYKFNDV